MFGSDYGGDHKRSRYKTYCFLIADTDASVEWPAKIRSIRDTHLPNGRRMSFKRLNEPRRQHALVPFLEAAGSLNGHLVGVVVHKDLRYLSTGANSLNILRDLLGIKGRWNRGSLESLVRKVHFFSLCVAQWAPIGADVTWITDEDEFVANDTRLDDAHQLTAKLSSLYVPHPLGVFAMNTTAIDDNDKSFEDFVAIPDLVAGMLSEVCTELLAMKNWRKGGKFALDEGRLSLKSEVISDWFWHPSFPLRRTCILIDKFDESRSSVKQLTML